jgi:AcrR family transcriptional regulator
LKSLFEIDLIIWFYIKMQKNQHNGTKERLLESACRVFSQKGYRDATIAEISSLARTNIAAVNYHFRNKKTLYIEAWRQAFHQSLEKYPPDGGVKADAPAEQRLYGRILSTLKRFENPNYEFEIIRKEFANPTGLLSEVIRKSIEPLHQQMFAIVKELLGLKVPEWQAQLCMRSIVTQCFNPMAHHRPKAADKNNFKPEIKHLQFNVEQLAQHITQFSLAGLREIRRLNEKGKSEKDNYKKYSK